MDTNLGEVVLVKDINPVSSNYYDRDYSYSGSSAGNFVEFNDKLYFSADDSENGKELWVSDGTTEGTQLLLDINPGVSYFYPGGYYYGVYDPNSLYSSPNGSYPENFVEFNDKLYFTAGNTENGRGLWVTDGTAEGTQFVLDISFNINSNTEDFIEFDDKLYFSADDNENGEELWVSDGTAEGTQLLLDLHPGTNYYSYDYDSYSPNRSSPGNFVEFKDRLYFTANNGENGNELWVSDGTAEGTQLLIDIRPGSDKYYDRVDGYGSYAENFTEFNDKLYFSANDGETGDELWVSDGTAEGTQLLLDIRPGSGAYGYLLGSSPDDFIEFNDKLYFSAYDVNSRRLWVSDGTAEGTQPLLDIYPDDFVEFNNKLYFRADDDENGSELWVTDGTAEGTQLVANINLRIDSYGNDFGSFPQYLTVVGDELLFKARSIETGGELFKLTVDRSNNIADEKTVVLAQKNDDTLNGGTDADTLIGSDGDDLLIGRGDDDNLIGKKGDDRFFGNSGSDTLIGGDGNDIFTLRPGTGEDIIIDFEPGSDRFNLVDGLQFSQLSFTRHSITAGDEILATLMNVDAESLTANDFVSDF